MLPTLLTAQCNYPITGLNFICVPKLPLLAVVGLSSLSKAQGLSGFVFGRNCLAARD